ncbi:MAG: ribonuclease HI [Candidatus Campbellbacteria bacterium]|nr:ribonuclease HI [Candidatus Campbellbacteria bacterium]
MKTIYIFTDGASKGNPGPGGWGAVLVAGNEVKEIGGFEENTTNNRMELIAAIKALEEVRSNETNSKEINVFSDSSYLINGITKWIYGWQKKNWKTTTKKDVANSGLWERLWEVQKNRNINWKYVPGHSDVAGNERANDIAEEFARGKDPDLFRGPEESYQIGLVSNEKPLGRDGQISDLEKARESKGKNKGKAYSYVSLLDGKIKTHSTWQECEKRVKGKPALYKKAMSKEDEKNIISEFRG